MFFPSQQKLVPVSARDIPTDVITNFPIWIQGRQKPQLTWLPGSVIHEESLIKLSGEKVLLAQDHVPFLMFYKHNMYWTHAKESDFDRFVLDFLNSVLFRVFYFHKMDNFTFIALYDFVDRFRYAWDRQMTDSVAALVRRPSLWPMAFRYRVYSAFAAFLLARKLGYSSFYDLIDFFLGALLCDIGHFSNKNTVQDFLDEKPKSWFFDTDHPDRSLAMLEGIEDLGLVVAQMIERHHECVDGSGFPKGYKGLSAVPEHAQLVGLVTEFVFDVLFVARREYGAEATDVTKSRFLKNRIKYAAEVFSNFVEVMNTLFP